MTSRDLSQRSRDVLAKTLATPDGRERIAGILVNRMERRAIRMAVVRYRMREGLPFVAPEGMPVWHAAMFQIKAEGFGFHRGRPPLLGDSEFLVVRRDGWL